MTAAKVATLAEFLLARIAEDDLAARRAQNEGRVLRGTDVGQSRLGMHFDRWEPARVLAECDAKRRIVELGDPNGDDEWVLCYLTLPYASHPDYRDEWRP